MPLDQALDQTLADFVVDGNHESGVCGEYLFLILFDFIRGMSVSYNIKRV